MLMLLSPAKSLDFESKLPTRKFTQPRFADQAAELAGEMRGKSLAEIAKLMHISDELAALNAARYIEFSTEHNRTNARPALFAFNGGVYQGMDAGSLTERDFTEAQKTVRILSGMYGLLRPLDLIQPYRLEMGTKLRTGRGSDLYQWWGDEIAAQVAEDLASSPGPAVLVNLASNEYFRAVEPLLGKVRVISPRFEDHGPGGKPRIVSFYAKRARGMMARWLVTQRARTVGAITSFAADGYTFDSQRSSPDVPVFVR